jgi:hypothetical protein
VIFQNLNSRPRELDIRDDCHTDEQWREAAHHDLSIIDGEWQQALLTDGAQRDASAGGSAARRFHGGKRSNFRRPVGSVTNAQATIRARQLTLSNAVLATRRTASVVAPSDLRRKDRTDAAESDTSRPPPGNAPPGDHRTPSGADLVSVVGERVEGV